MFKRVIFLVLIFIIPAISLAEGTKINRISGIYSNLKYNSESGDLSGIELLIFPNNHVHESEYSGFFQISEGGAPFAVIVPIKVSGANIEFTLPSGPEFSNMHFVGEFKGSELILRSLGNEEHLKRGKSYWQVAK
jgi:hypothetical protein